MSQETGHTLISYPKSMLTTRQQGQVRAKLMETASRVAGQLDGYVDENKVTLANGEKVSMSPARLQAYRLILERTIPTLASTEIRHKSSLEALSTDALVTRLAALAKQRPELAAKLLEAMGGRVIEPDRREGETVTVERVVEAEVVVEDVGS